MTALSDYSWQIIGDYQVADDLLLNDPVFQCTEVNYDTKSRTAKIVLKFVEGQSGKYAHYRQFNSILPVGDESIDAAMIVAFVLAQFPTAIQIKP